ncbi:MAG: hypothetical protein WC360_09170 [Opitutales bacterium]|jgi:hypothetical protein
MDQPVQTSPQEERRYAELQLMALDYARAGDAPALDAMLAAGLPANLCDEKGNTLLMLAAMFGNEGVYKLLASRGGAPAKNRVFGIPSCLVLGISSRIRKLLRRIPARRSPGKPL